jgi:hypothetical protein
MYEAGFQFDRLLAFLDILSRDKGHWLAYEVKSSYQISDTFLLDAAFQYYVIRNSGLALKDFFIVYASKKAGDESSYEAADLRSHFIKESVLDRILPMQELIANEVQKQKSVLRSQAPPDIPMGLQCNTPYPCDFIGYCSRSAARK